MQFGGMSHTCALSVDGGGRSLGRGVIVRSAYKERDAPRHRGLPRGINGGGLEMQERSRRPVNRNRDR